MKGYYDFVDENFVEGETPARDDTGHGSDMVDLLHKTAPGVSIFVARVFAKNTGSDRYAICAAKVSFRNLSPKVVTNLRPRPLIMLEN